MHLPEKFTERMKGLLGEQYEDFAASYEREPRRGIRINALKLSAERVAELGMALDSVPFAPEGFAVADDEIKLGNTPWHHAGAYYVQEPSAMSAVTALEPLPGERVLDMCAAPGGKSTQIAARLCGSGLLWSNEYVRTRAQALISNIERMGVRNAVVSSLHPDRIAEGLEGWFDRVLVDAPCSGEGMFRRDEQAIVEWSQEHAQACAARQAGILDSAARCVAEGGVLVYSTCTFSPEENELTVAAFLQRHPDFCIEPITAQFGREGIATAGCDTAMTRRIYPMDGGEGHFVARMRRMGEKIDGTQHERCVEEQKVSREVRSCAEELLESCFAQRPSGELAHIGDELYLLPEGYPSRCAVPVIRAGVHLGTVKSGGRSLRIEPAHALFMSAEPQHCRALVDLAPEDSRLLAFLHGEQIEIEENLRGYAAVACSGVICGFGKCDRGALKNKYPKGLRLLG